MIIPKTDPEYSEYVNWVHDTCMLSAKERKDMYDRRRQFFLYGTSSDQDVVYNRLYSHIDLVCSFLYSPDHAEYSIAAAANAADADVKQFMAAQDQFNNDFRDAGGFDVFADALNWSVAMDSQIIKMGWSDTRQDLTFKLVQPWDFGVFSEEETELENQPALAHRFHIDYDNAVQRLERAGLGHRIKDIAVVNTPFQSPFPELLTRMIIASTAGENLGGNVTGSVNPSYVQRPSYRPKIDRPLVEFSELTVWDDECEDYRLFQIIAPGIILSDSKKTYKAIMAAAAGKRSRKMLEKFTNTQCNLFFPREHPFVLVRPYFMYEYFWGKAHIEDLIPLQEWSNERLDQIHDILDKQSDPAKVLSGFMGLSDEKAGAFGGAGSWVMDQLPSAAVKELYPEMPPDIFADYMQIGQLMVEASGLNEVLQGKGEAGVRGRGHAKQLQQTGAGRIKKTASRLEDPLTRMGDLAMKLKRRNDDDQITPDPKEDGKPGTPFYYADLPDDFVIRIAGHSHSPLFTDDTKEMAAFLMKAQAIDQENLLRMLNPPNRNNLIHALRTRQKKQAQKAQMLMQMGINPDAPPPKSGGKKNGLGAHA